MPSSLSAHSYCHHEDSPPSQLLCFSSITAPSTSLHFMFPGHRTALPINSYASALTTPVFPSSQVSSLPRTFRHPSFPAFQPSLSIRRNTHHSTASSASSIFPHKMSLHGVTPVILSLLPSPPKAHVLHAQCLSVPDIAFCAFQSWRLPARYNAHAEPLVVLYHSGNAVHIAN